MISLKDAVCRIRKILFDAHISNYKNEAAELVARCANISRSQLVSSSIVLSNEQEQALLNDANKRAGGYPLQYILGEWDFYGNTFFVGEGVLIPRADTECLIDVCCEYLSQCGMENINVLDLCSGSGCIAITLKKLFPHCHVYAVEKSEPALEYLCKNVKRHQVDISVLNADALVNDDTLPCFNLIVSNPPYLTARDMQHLQREVCHEPAIALYGKEDGLHFYREISRVWQRNLAAGGMLAFEIGHTQAEMTADLLMQLNYKNICTKVDLCGIIRCIYCTH